MRRLTSTLICCITSALLAGCGSGATKTVTISSAPDASTTASSATQTTPSAPAKTTNTQTSTTAPAQTTTAGGTQAPGTTRTAPAPAFTEQEPHTGGVKAAVGVVREHGYTPNDASEYHSGQTLTVLVGTRTGSGDGYGQQAFFFVNGKYIGTDTKEPSATVEVISQSATEVTLAYPLYRKGDPLSSPSGGQSTVHFQLNNGKLIALGTIPPASSRN